MRRLRTLMFATALAAALGAGAPQVAAAACTPYLAYFDLGAGGGTILGGPPGTYTQLRSDTVVTTPYNPISTCANPSAWRAVVAKVDVPAGCEGVSIWVQYEGEPVGFTTDIGDSDTNNGFGGDGGSLPHGQVAEVQVLNDGIEVYNAVPFPTDVLPDYVEQLVTQQLALKDGALNFVIKDQYVSWGQPSTILRTPHLKRLFFLPPAPVTAPDNRTLYVSFNRVIAPTGSPDTARNGCGARRALLVLQ